jgi:hypothetical protein
MFVGVSLSRVWGERERDRSLEPNCECYMGKISGTIVYPFRVIIFHFQKNGGK